MFSASALELMIQYMYKGSYNLAIFKSAPEESAAPIADSGTLPSPALSSDTSPAPLSDYIRATTTGFAHTHIEVYAVADYYDVPGLKDLALKKFSACQSAVDDMDDLMSLVHAVYKNTSQRDDGLRQSIVREAAKRGEALVSNTLFVALASSAVDNKDFAVDVLNSLYCASRLEKVDEIEHLKAEVKRLEAEAKEGRLDDWRI